MSATDNNDGTVETEAVEKLQSIGQILKVARLDRNMSIQDVARQLRLSESQVTAIEEDDYSKFSGRTFLHGFIRNYAKLVHTDTVEFQQLLQQTFPPVSSHVISYPVEGTPFTASRKQSRSSLVILWGAVLVSLFLIYEVYRSGGDDSQLDENVESGNMTEISKESKTEIKQGNESAKLQLPPTISSNNSDAIDLSGNEDVASQENNITNQQNTAQTITSHKPINNDESIIHFVFNEESWVEVKDATGKRIFSQISPGNTEKMLYGKSPFSLTIGNAANVRLVYNSKPVDLTPYTSKYGGVARLSLE